MTRKIKVFEAFAGYGSTAIAMKRLQKQFPADVDFEFVGVSEIEPSAIKAYTAIHGECKNYGDISLIDWNQVPDFDLFTYSSPCFIAGTWIRTDKGLKRIEDISAGDYVLTHTNEYKKVARTMKRSYNGVTYSLDCPLFDRLVCTQKHPLYVREKQRNHDSSRRFCNPEWLSPRDIMQRLTKDPVLGVASARGFHIGYAINKESRLPEWMRSTMRQMGHNNPDKELSELFSNNQFWYLMGRYVGDGWKRESHTGNGIVICCGGRNEDKLTSAMEQCGIHYSKAMERTVAKYHINSAELHKFVDRYGYYAHGKHIDAETLSLPIDLLKGFLEGIIDSDGCQVKNWYQVTSVSEELIYDIAHCVAKVYHRGFSINFHKRPKKTIIENREVNQRDTWMIRWKISDDKQDRMFYDDGYIWAPLMKLTWQQSRCEVYNMEVEEDNSYTANGVIVHNCQDFSQAGKQAGAEEGSGTRSSLLWECRRAILAKKPKYLLFENVSAVVSKKFKPLFLKWVEELEGYGYSNFYQLCNSKDFDCPQNRLRIFMVSILKDNEDDKPIYNFPQAMPLTKCVEDIMVPLSEVPEDAWIDPERVTAMVVRDIIDQPNVYEELLWRYHVEEASRRLYGRSDFDFMMQHYDELAEYAEKTLGATNPDK